MKRDWSWLASMLSGFFVMCAIFGLLLLALNLCGCGYGKTACSIIDTAHDACVVLRYLGPDGKPRDVRVPRAELEAYARMTAAKQAAADGGAE